MQTRDEEGQKQHAPKRRRRGRRGGVSEAEADDQDTESDSEYEAASSLLDDVLRIIVQVDDATTVTGTALPPYVRRDKERHQPGDFHDGVKVLEKNEVTVYAVFVAQLLYF